MSSLIIYILDKAIPWNQKMSSYINLPESFFQRSTEKVSVLTEKNVNLALCNKFLPKPIYIMSFSYRRGINYFTLTFFNSVQSSYIVNVQVNTSGSCFLCHLFMFDPSSNPSFLLPTIQTFLHAFSCLTLYPEVPKKTSESKKAPHRSCSFNKHRAGFAPAMLLGATVGL